MPSPTMRYTAKVPALPTPASPAKEKRNHAAAGASQIHHVDASPSTPVRSPLSTVANSLEPRTAPAAPSSAPALAKWSLPGAWPQAKRSRDGPFAASSNAPSMGKPADSR